jgi:hypothetical protein
VCEAIGRERCGIGGAEACRLRGHCAIIACGAHRERAAAARRVLC